MANYRKVFETEKYMDDALETILNNISKGVKRTKQPGIWDPIEPPIEIESYDSDQSERNKILTKILSENHNSLFSPNTKRCREENRYASGTAVKRSDFANRRPPKSFYPYEQRSNQSNDGETKTENSIREEYKLECKFSKASNSGFSHPIKRTDNENDQNKMPSSNVIVDSNLGVQNSGSVTLSPLSFVREEQGNPHDKTNDKLLLNSSVSEKNLDAPSMGSETSDVVSQTDQSSNFKAWCKRRHEQFNIDRSNDHLSQCETKTAISISEVKKPKEKYQFPVMKNKISDHAKKNLKSKSEVDISGIVNKKSNHAIKYSKMKSELDVSNLKNETINSAKKYPTSKSKDNLPKTQACIKLANENYDKSYELVVDVAHLSRIKRKFPKLNNILPEIDTPFTTVSYCFEAVTIILRSLFYGWSNNLPIASTAVEVLAATKNWDMENFYSKFYGNFIKILPSSNIKFIYSQASHYDLHDVCSACQEINLDDASLKSSTYKRKQKTTSIIITTYIEPLEFCIPLHTLKNSNFELNFKKDISNTIRFQALSGVFTIFGIYINLDIDDESNNISEESNNISMLNIDYNVKIITKELEFENGRFEKPLRPINVIHFKNPLEVNPKQIVEITVEAADLNLCLCSTYPEEKDMRLKEKGAEFRLNVSSNLKVTPKSKENLLIVGKLLYYVKVQPN